MTNHQWVDVSEKLSETFIFHLMLFFQWSRKLKMISSKSCKQKLEKCYMNRKKLTHLTVLDSLDWLTPPTEMKKNVGFNTDKIMYVEARTKWDERVPKKELLWKGLRHLGRQWYSYIKWKFPCLQNMFSRWENTI